MRWLVDEAYPDVPVIRLVLDNLNTHRMASLYETFPAAEARRIAKRLEFHHTPKHGSWLNMAEIEFSVLARACLRGRNGDAPGKSRQRLRVGAERDRATINCGSLPKKRNSIAFIPANPDLLQLVPFPFEYALYRISVTCSPRNQESRVRGSYINKTIWILN